jgi:glycosyltransferase involved in cell wall biosynthesis
METVSILIPCYNNEEHIGAAIESGLNQTWPECEIIVVDDGSTDESRVVARRYESEGVRVIAQENSGAPAARNRALNAAEGDYVQYLDADDLLHPKKIEAQVQVLKESPPRCVSVAPTCYFDDGEDPEEGRLSRGDPSLINSDDPVQWLINLWTPGEGWGMVQTGAWLTPRPVVEEAGPWKEYISPDDDGEYFTRVLLASSGVRYEDEGCAYYRQHESGTRVSGMRSREALGGWIRNIDSRRDHLLPLTTGKQREDASYGLARMYWTVALNAYPTHSEIAGIAESRAAELGFSDPLHTMSENGWRGQFAQSIQSLLGWRTARLCQTRYHQVRKMLS